MMLLIYIMSFTLSFLFILITLTFYMKSIFNKNKMSPFECGFNPMNSSRNSFSIQFFLISILFLVFDIEIIIILPLPITLLKTYLFLISSTLTIMILMAGLIFEWYMGSLKWT